MDSLPRSKTGERSTEELGLEGRLQLSSDDQITRGRYTIRNSIWTSNGRVSIPDYPIRIYDLSLMSFHTIHETILFTPKGSFMYRPYGFRPDTQ